MTPTPSSPLTPPDLALAQLHFHLRMTQQGELPVPAGAALRGGIALLLKRQVCLYPQHQRCVGCPLLHNCVYPAIFEPAPPPDSEVLSTHESVPLPIVLQLTAERVAETPPRYQPGDVFSFGVVLVGRATRHIPYLVAAVEHLGRSGLGSDRVRFQLSEVTALRPDRPQPSTVYAAGLMYSADAVFSSLAQALPPLCARLTMHFETATRLKFDGQFLYTPPPFHVVIRTLLRRISSLSYFHGDTRWQIDYRGWITQAETVINESDRVRWQEFSRYSTRQQQRMRLGGLVGPVTYCGDITPFLPILRLGELLHLGKGTVFGNGRYVLEPVAGKQPTAKAGGLCP